MVFNVLIIDQRSESGMSDTIIVS